MKLMPGALVGICFLVFSGCVFASERGAAGTVPMDYRVEMQNLIVDLSGYARKKEGDFIVLPNGGTGIYHVDEGNAKERVDRLIGSVDGALIESFFYGYEMEDDNEMPAEEQRYYRENLKSLEAGGLPVFNIDYCHRESVARNSRKKNQAEGFISMAASNRALNEIPYFEIAGKNDRDIRSLKDVKNFLVLLNPEKFHGKKNFIADLKNTDYDLLIIDFFADGTPLTKADVENLKTKKNGGERLVLAYMSVGEAEDYRVYWKEDWNSRRPAWMVEPNADWVGSYKVKYWEKEWKNLLYGSEDAYLDQILAAGFDGVFLDVVDAYVYFDEQREKQK